MKNLNQDNYVEEMEKFNIKIKFIFSFLYPCIISMWVINTLSTGLDIYLSNKKFVIFIIILLSYYLLIWKFKYKLYFVKEISPSLYESTNVLSLILYAFISILLTIPASYLFHVKINKYDFLLIIILITIFQHLIFLIQRELNKLT